MYVVQRFKEWRQRKAEDAWYWVARRVPKKLAYWVYIRVGVHATTGRYSLVEVPNLSMLDALECWREDL